MISLVEKEIIRQWPVLTGNQALPSSLNCLQISGTNWEGGRVRFAVLDQQGRPILFIRMMRNPKNDSLLEKEYRLIASLIGNPAIAAYLPKPCFIGEVSGQKFVVERAVAGESVFKDMHRRLWNPRNPFNSHINMAKNILIELAKGTKKCVSKKQLFDIVLAPINKFYFKSGGNTSDLETIIGKLTRNSKGCLETVATHGDFSPKNLILRPDGYCTVIDWETARINGLPLIDLFYFLSRYAYLSGSSRRESQARRIKAFYESSRSDAKWARLAVEQYCLQMKYDPGIINPLFRLHFLYKAWIKWRMAGMYDKSTKFWLDLFHFYLSVEETPWGL